MQSQVFKSLCWVTSVTNPSKCVNTQMQQKKKNGKKKEGTIENSSIIAQSTYLSHGMLWRTHSRRDSCLDSPCSPRKWNPRTSLRRHCNASEERNHDTAPPSLEPYSGLVGHKITDYVWFTADNKLWSFSLRSLWLLHTSIIDIKLH